jgi:hypothetical protein
MQGFPPRLPGSITYGRLRQRNNILIAHRTAQNFPYILECSLVLGQWMPYLNSMRFALTTAGELLENRSFSRDVTANEPRHPLIQQTACAPTTSVPSGTENVIKLN